MKDYLSKKDAKLMLCCSLVAWGLGAIMWLLIGGLMLKETPRNAVGTLGKILFGIGLGGFILYTIPVKSILREWERTKRAPINAASTLWRYALLVLGAGCLLWLLGGIMLEVAPGERSLMAIRYGRALFSLGLAATGAYAAAWFLNALFAPKSLRAPYQIGWTINVLAAIAAVVASIKILAILP